MKKAIPSFCALPRRCVLLLCCAAAQLNAQTTWTAGSATDFNWSNADNWSASEPTLSTDVIFPTPIPNPGGLPSPATILLSAGELAQSLTFNASGHILNGGTLQLAAPGNITITTAGHNATINSVLTGVGGLTKLGAGSLILGGANDLSGVIRVLDGTLTIASGGSLGVASASADSLQIAERSTATLVVQSGGQLKVGSGSSSFLHVGSRGNAAGTAATVGTVDLSALSSFTANVGEFHIGVGTVSNVGTTRGTALLAASNTISATSSIIVGDMVPSLDNSTLAAGTSQLAFGSGSNNLETPLFIVGGSRSRGSVSLAAGGTLTLGNGAGATTLHIGRNAVTSTVTTSEGTMNLSEGTFIANLDELIIGARITGTQSNTGAGVGTLSIGGSALNNVTASSVLIGSLGSSGASTNVTLGTLNFGGGAFSVTGDVTMANYTASGGLVRGTLNLTGGTFTVGGNILKTNHASSTSVIIVDGATLDMTNGTLGASQLVWRSGSIINIASAGVTLDAISTTTGQGSTGDALIFRDVDVSFAVSLTGASGGSLHYEAGSGTLGGTISGNIALGSTVRGFNIEDSANAAIDTHVSGVISGTGGINKTGAGTLRLGNANTHSGVTTVGEGLIIAANALALQNSTVTLNVAGGLQFASGIQDFTLGSLAGNTSGTLMLADAAAQAVNLTLGGNNATSTFSGLISGAGTLLKAGTGTLTLAGGAANTHSGLTTVVNGVLLLSKTGNVTAIAGNISLLDGGDLRFGGNAGQLASTTQITINGNHSTFNGTASNAGVSTITETFASLTVTRGVVNAGFVTSQLTVTGASSFTGTTGTTKDDSTLYIGNSGSSFSTGSLSLTDMTGAGGTESANSFTVFGNNDTIQTTLRVGAGGLLLENSNLYLNRGTNANTLGSRLVLEGDITVNGASPSAIVTNSGSIGQAEIQLGGTAGNFTRVIETNADFTISSDITKGAATLAGITKTGVGTLTLSGANSHNGVTLVSAGTLSITSSASLGDASATNTLSLASGTTLRYTGTVSSDLGADRGVALGAGAVTMEVTQATGSLIISGALTGAGTGTFTKAGAGTLTLADGDLSVLSGRGLTLAAGTLSFENNAGVIVALGDGALHLADQTTLRMDVGSLANYDRISSTAAAVVAANATIRIDVTALAGMTANTTYDLITAGAGSGFNAAGLTWQLSLAGDFKYQLGTTDTMVRLQTLGAVTADAYWRGDIDGSWSSIILGGGANNTNWNTDLTGGIDREAGPGTASTVYFSASAATGPAVSTTLDNHFNINDIVFLASPSGVTSVAIAQGALGSLTFTPADPAKGVTVQDNAGAVSITAPVTLGAAQTWSVSATGASLAVNGIVSGASDASLTKTGAGTLTLGGSNTYTGRTIIQAGTIAINAENRLGSNAAAFAADHLTLNGGTLQSTATFAIDDANRGLTLGAGGGTFNTNASTTLTVSNVIAGSGTLTKSGGTGTLALSKANTFTGNTTVLAGTLRIASGGSIGVASATAGSLQIGDRSTATLTVDAGGSLKVGNGASSTLYVGTRTTDAGTAATVGTLNMSAATSFIANVGKFYIGVADTGSASGNTQGIVTLAQNNTITARVEILVGQMTPALANQGVISQLNFGSGINNITTPSLTIGSRKSAATSTIAAGGVLNLANGAGKTNLYIGRNNNSGTSTNASGTLDLTNGTFNATLGTVIVGERSASDGGASDGSGAGSGTGTLTLGDAANNVTADSLTLGNLRARGSSTVTKGTLNMAGGTFAVSGDVGIGNNTSAVNGALAEGVLNLTGGAFTVGGNVNVAFHTTSTTGADLSKGTLNITGGIFTVNGNITTSNKTTSSSTVALDGGTLDMTNGSIDVDAFNAQSGTLKNVSQIFNGSGTVAAELNKTTAGTLILSGTNSYTGATTVTAGILEVQGTSGTGVTTVKTTATLAGAGTIQSAAGTLVESGGTLKPGSNLGDAVGTLTFNSSLELQAGSTAVFQLSGATGTAAHPLSIEGALLNGALGNHDHISISGSLTLGSTTTFGISLVGYTAGFGDVFNLFDWSAAGSATANGFSAETDFNFDLAVLDAGLAWETDRFLTDGIIYVVPEPSRGLLLLSGMILCLLRRRR